MCEQWNECFILFPAAEELCSSCTSHTFCQCQERLFLKEKKMEGVYTAFHVHSLMHSTEILSPGRWQHRRHLIYDRLLSCHYVYPVYLPSSTILGCLPFLKKKKKLYFTPKKFPAKMKINGVNGEV